MDNRILITGAQGFIGRYLTAALIKEFDDIEIVGIGRSEQMRDSFTHTIKIHGEKRVRAPLPLDLIIDTENYKYFSVNTLDQTKLIDVFRSFSPTVLIHLASGLKGDTCSKLFDTNIRGTLNVLSACEAYDKTIPFISISSGSVYGFHSRAEQLPFPETLQCNPEDPYQFAKATEEVLVKDFCKKSNIPWMILRVFSVLGPGQDERHVCGKFVSELINIKSGYKEAILNVFPLTSERDFVDVRDVATNIVKLLKSGQYNQVYNICSSKPTIINEVLNLCLGSVFGDHKDKVKIKRADNFITTGEVDKNYGDNSKLLNAGGSIDFAISTSIKDIVSYYNLLYDTYYLKKI